MMSQIYPVLVGTAASFGFIQSLFNWRANVYLETRIATMSEQQDQLDQGLSDVKAAVVAVATKFTTLEAQLNAQNQNPAVDLTAELATVADIKSSLAAIGDTPETPAA